MVKYIDERPETVTEDFWIELSKLPVGGETLPIYAFMLSPDGTSPRVVTKITVEEFRGEDDSPKNRIVIHGTDYKWGWDSSDTMSWWDMNDGPRFAGLEVCCPTYLYNHRYKGTSRNVEMPQEIKDRIVLDKVVQNEIRSQVKAFTAGIASTLWAMLGNVESETSAYEIMRGSEDAKYLLTDDNRKMMLHAEELCNLAYYNLLSKDEDDWDFYDDLIWNAGKMLDNNGSVSVYPDDGDGLDLHDITLDEWNKVQRSIAITTLYEVINFVRKWCIESFQYDPHFNKDEAVYTPLTTEG